MFSSLAGLAAALVMLFWLYCAVLVLTNPKSRKLSRESEPLLPRTAVPTATYNINSSLIWDSTAAVSTTTSLNKLVTALDTTAAKTSNSDSLTHQRNQPHLPNELLTQIIHDALDVAFPPYTLTCTLLPAQRLHQRVKAYEHMAFNLATTCKTFALIVANRHAQLSTMHYSAWKLNETIEERDPVSGISREVWVATLSHYAEEVQRALWARARMRKFEAKMERVRSVMG